MPATGGWVRLDVPAASVGLEGQSVTGLAFTLYGGAAAFDREGALAGSPETPLADDRLSIYGTAFSEGPSSWIWGRAPPRNRFEPGPPARGAPGLSPGVHGDVRRDGADVGRDGRLPLRRRLHRSGLPAGELMLNWEDSTGSWEHPLLGCDDIAAFADGTVGNYHVGALGTSGSWVRRCPPRPSASRATRSSAWRSPSTTAAPRTNASARRRG